MKPLVSVVVPACNEEADIRDCLDSILNQTFADFELLCIDNGSTDSTVEIMERYAAADPRVRVLFSEGTAGDARNIGMDAARGKYLLFLDSDDFFADDLLKDTVQAAEAHEADIVLFGGKRYDDREGTLSDKVEFISYYAFPKQQEVFSAQDVSEKLFQITTPAPWSKLFLRELAIDNGLRFQSLPNSNDLFFTFSALSKAKRITGINKDYVRYRVNKKSSSQKDKARAPLCFFDALEALHDFLVANGDEELFANTLKRQILSTTKYNLNTSSTNEAKDAIFQYLVANWHGWLGLDWEEGDEAYTKPTNDLRDYIQVAIRCHEMFSADLPIVNPDLECVIPRRTEGAPAVSVIIPAYNTGSIVRETLRSIADQSLHDIEMICIDDGSNDNTLETMIAFSREDERVSVYHQDNSGLSMARNAGLSHAAGDYIFFIDSDDKISLEALELVYKEAAEGDLDAVLFEAVSFYDDEDLEDKGLHYDNYYHRNGEYEEVYDGLDLLNEFCTKGDYLSSACMYIAKKELLDSYGAHFIPGILHEDNAYTFQLMLNAKRVKCINEPLYLRRLRHGSIMISATRFDNIYGYFVCIKDMLSVLFAHGGEGQRSEELSEAFRIVMNAAISAQNKYKELPESELGGVAALRVEDKALFSKLIARSGNRLRTIDKQAATIERQNEKYDKKVVFYEKKLKWLRGKLAARERELESIKNSRSYKVANKLQKIFKSEK